MPKKVSKNVTMAGKLRTPTICISSLVRYLSAGKLGHVHHLPSRRLLHHLLAFIFMTMSIPRRVKENNPHYSFYYPKISLSHHMSLYKKPLPEFALANKPRLPFTRNLTSHRHRLVQHIRPPKIPRLPSLSPLPPKDPHHSRRPNNPQPRELHPSPPNCRSLKHHISRDGDSYR